MSERSLLIPPRNNNDDHEDDRGGGSRQDYATLPPPPPPPSPTIVTSKHGTAAGAILSTILLTLTTLLLPLILFTALLINSFIPSDQEITRITDSALLYNPAEAPQVSLLNFTSGYTGVWIEVGADIGVDVDVVLGINGAVVEKDGRGHGARWWEALRTWVGRRGIDMVGPLAVMIPEPVVVYPQETKIHIHHAHNAVDDLENGNREKQLPKRKKPLFTVSLPTPLPIPLISGSNKQLPHHSYHLHISISHPATLLAYTHKAWLNGSAHFAVHVPRVIVVPADTHGLFVWWRRWIKVEQQNLVIPQCVQVPEFAGIPGPKDHLADYITLESYGFHTAALPPVPGHNQDDDDDNRNNPAVGNGHNPPNVETSDGTSRQWQAQTSSRQEKEESGKKQLRVSAVASARNPFYNTTLINLAQRPISIPLELGFGIFLSANKQSSATLDQAEVDADAGTEKGSEMRQERKRRKEDRLVKMAEVVTMPFSLHGQERVRIHVEGVVKTGRRHTDDTSEDEDGAALSTFLNNYLQGRANNVTILGLPAFPIDASPDARINATNPSSGSSVVPPAWMQRLVSENVHAVIPFPAPSNRTNLIRSVTIEQMKISERAGKMRASGVVVVVASLPRDLAGVEVQVAGVLPDVLVSDGKFEGGGEVDPGTPPYPARAFGRIHPTEFLPAISSPSPDDPTLLIVRAPLHDVPLDILPGRDKVLSDFVAKIVFKGFAEAGIVGNAGVRVDVVGVGKAVEVRKVPVTGVVNVGRPRVV